MNKTENQLPQNNFIIIPESEITCEQLYVDGVSGTMMGPANSKIAFHQVVSVDPLTMQEKRKIVLNTIIPTSVLVEFCQNILKGIQENSNMMKTAISENEAKILSNIPPTK